MNNIPAEVKDFLRYDRETGDFFWLVNRPTRYGREGEKAGHIKKSTGYVCITVLGQKFFAHRLAWFFEYGEIPTMIDHANGICTDNRICNLRAANTSQNTSNQALQNRNKLRAKGVRQTSGTSRFQARITHAGMVHHLGSFRTLDEAAHAYNKMAIQLHGDFAVLNPVGADYVL